MVCNRGCSGARSYSDGKMTIPMKTRWIWALAVVVIFAAAAPACTVPTFRYALERWPADAYEVLVFHRGELSEADQAAVKLLEDISEAEEGDFANVAVYTVDLADKEVEKEVAKMLPAAAEGKLPWMLMRFPRSHRIAESLISAPLSAATVKTVLNSPKRAEIVKRLTAGQSAVLVLLESGKGKVDDAAAAMLTTELKKLETELKLPELVPPGLELPPDLQLPKLRVAFSVLRVSRNDPAEKLLVDMLLRAEPDLADAKYAGEPMVMPIFGRARAMYALVGEGINPENIGEACYILIAPCSCEIKEQLTGAGIDLLVTADWEEALGGVMLSYLRLPPLMGMATSAPATVPTTAPPSAPAIAPAALAAADEAPPSTPATEAGLLGNVLWGVLVAMGVMVILVVGFAIALKYHNPQR